MIFFFFLDPMIIDTFLMQCSDPPDFRGLVLEHFIFMTARCLADKTGSLWEPLRASLFKCKVAREHWSTGVGQTLLQLQGALRPLCQVTTALKCPKDEDWSAGTLGRGSDLTGPSFCDCLSISTGACLDFVENKVYVEIKVQTAVDSTLSLKCLNRLLTCLDIARVGSVIKGPGRELCQVMGSIFQIL